MIATKEKKVYNGDNKKRLTIPSESIPAVSTGPKGIGVPDQEETGTKRGGAGISRSRKKLLKPNNRQKHGGRRKRGKALLRCKGGGKVEEKTVSLT